MFKQYVHRYEAKDSRKQKEGSFKVFSYTKSKVGLISSTVVEENGLEDKNYVSLFYDKKSGRIGLKFHTDPDPGSVRLSSAKKNGRSHKTKIICLNGFLSQFNPPVAMKKEYPVLKASAKSPVDLIVQL